ncbi:hypothetical protein Gasu2_35130 [Galdieria sulphuraria]|uniref:Signal recognition particle 14 kDa protein n=1 Tax=Galdieria sulphuraria TaxID=130081 RepID=M2WU29_GALSU|nr:signal recognition particle subunit SRP14 [Galdieria sulphuraria]EME27415.1 signal recognition particle subunit SRP14 [Galdieria sulphuraria]GJD09252.1 hypothetical protein Gasu2_35130 [Galdieria sulphuraria]|eukprot:XP_005703935.1 signal recognition particle subunit SRP14 [Galdieria sulphuraria]
MVRLGPDRFIKRLSSLYEENKDQGTVWVTMKRVGEGKKQPKESACLIRATDGRKKISCLITSSSKSVDFEQQLNSLMGVHLFGAATSQQKTRKQSSSYKKKKTT